MCACVLAFFLKQGLCDIWPLTLLQQIGGINMRYREREKKSVYPMRFVLHFPMSGKGFVKCQTYLSIIRLPNEVLHEYLPNQCLGSGLSERGLPAYLHRISRFTFYVTTTRDHSILSMIFFLFSFNYSLHFQFSFVCCFHFHFFTVLFFFFFIIIMI